MDFWKLQDAKARFSEVVERAMAHGPQVITRHGQNAVVIMDYKDFKTVSPVEDFKTFLLSSRGSFDLPMTRGEHITRKNDFEKVPS